jgi:uncharacterized protein (DUF3084 family)
MYGQLLAALNQASNPPIAPSAQQPSTPGQITAARLEIQKALSQKESELKLKDRLLQHKDELLNVLRQNGSMKDEKIKQKDEQIKKRDDKIKVRTVCEILLWSSTIVVKDPEACYQAPGFLSSTHLTSSSNDHGLNPCAH